MKPVCLPCLPPFIKRLPVFCPQWRFPQFISTRLFKLCFSQFDNGTQLCSMDFTPTEKVSRILDFDNYFHTTALLTSTQAILLSVARQVSMGQSSWISLAVRGVYINLSESLSVWLILRTLTESVTGVPFPLGTHLISVRKNMCIYLPIEKTNVLL